MTEDQIAKNMGIGIRTLTTWKTRFPSILASLKKGKAPVDQSVENALLRRALGFEYTETVEEEITLPNGKIQREKKTVHKIALPDTTAQIFWLKNRRPDKWRDKQDITGMIEPVQIIWGKQ